ncbi:MAG TPA: hypothetical protein VHT91_03015 [Kofleriaceae bacterium]|nr:hypothetical protein [Kofleriaceae bacterium]
MTGFPGVFRVTYARYGELRDDLAQQLARGGLLVKVHDAPGLDFDSAIALELVLPDGTTLLGLGKVLQVFAGVGFAVTVQPELVEEVSRFAGRPEVAASGTARHERVERPITHPAPPARPRRTSAPSSLWISSAPLRRPATTPPPLAAVPRATPTHTPLPIVPPPVAAEPPPVAADPPPAAAEPPPAATAAARHDTLSRMEKVQKALHGTRDERNAILRDRDRTLHAFVLKNPQLDADDLVGIARNPQLAADLLQQVGDRKEWLQRPAIALALARNPKTPPELAVRALDHVPLEAVRQLAKGAGALPHVQAAARKKLLG